MRTSDADLPPGTARAQAVGVDLQPALEGELDGSMFGLGLRTVVELP